MPEINEANALTLWENGEGLSVLDRAVRMAAMAGGITTNSAADLTISDRDRLLLAALHRASSGAVPVIAPCPTCNMVNEADVVLAAMLRAQDQPSAIARIGRRRAAVRPPSSRELAAAIASGDLASLTARYCEPGDKSLPPEAAQAVEAALERAFPLLNIMISMQCGGCGENFAQRFDPVPLLWAQVVTLAKRAIADVDLLARTYGWSETEVLALSPARRRLYCEAAAR